jgi:hypothetical protein
MGTPPAEAVGQAGEIRRLEELVAHLRQELDVRRREVFELHQLLQQAQGRGGAASGRGWWWRRRWRS